jgi:ABC-type transport system involved in multi-copper enzyme maturation permease subunit
MKISEFSTGFLFMLLYEFKRVLKGSISSYLWFAVLVYIATYSLFAESYMQSANTEKPLITLEYGSEAMRMIILFFYSFVISSAPGVLSGDVPSLAFPPEIGVMFFIIVPMILGLIMISKFIMKKATVIIAREKEKKTLFITVSSPQTRPAIYLCKFIAVFIIVIPMILYFYFITNWAFTGLFPLQTNLSGVVFKTAIGTAMLFTSIGMLVSVVRSTEEKAVKFGMKIVILMATLTSLWIFIPVIELILNLTNNSTFFLMVLEKITYISPFTMDLMAANHPGLLADMFNIQLIATVIFLVIGIVIFIRQDLEY